MDDRRPELEMQLSAYLDDELEPRERQDVEALLASDESARALLEQLRATIAAVHGLPRMKASEQLIESLRSRMERQSLLDAQPAPLRIGAPERSYFRWTAAAAVIALTATAGYLMWGLAQDRLGSNGQHYAAIEKPTTPTPDADDQGASRSDETLSERGAVTAAPPSAPGGPKDVPALTKGEEKPDLAVGAVTMARPPAVEAAPPLGSQAVAFGRPSTDEISAESLLPDADSTTRGLGAARYSMGVIDLAPSATIVELTFADAARQQEAVQLLLDEYAFQPAGQPAQSAGEIEFYAKYVPTEESAREIANRVERSITMAESVRVVPPTPVPEACGQLLRPSPADAGLADDSQPSRGRRAGAPSTTAPPAPPLREAIVTPPATEPLPPQEQDKAAAPSSPASPAAQPPPPDTPVAKERAAGIDQAGKPAARRMAAGRPSHDGRLATQPESEPRERLGLAALAKKAGTRPVDEERMPRAAAPKYDATPTEGLPTRPAANVEFMDGFGRDWYGDLANGFSAVSTPHVVRLYLWVEPTAPPTTARAAETGQPMTPLPSPATQSTPAKPPTPETQPTPAM